MRKLLLASFAWKIGENQHTDNRLIAIDSTPNTLEETDRHNAIEAFLKWWNETKTEEQVYLYVQCHPTIDATKRNFGPVTSADCKSEIMPAKSGLGLSGQFLEWFSRQDSEYVKDWYAGKVSNEQVIKAFNNPDRFNNPRN